MLSADGEVLQVLSSEYHNMDGHAVTIVPDDTGEAPAALGGGMAKQTQMRFLVVKRMPSVEETKQSYFIPKLKARSDFLTDKGCGLQSLL